MTTNFSNEEKEFLKKAKRVFENIPKSVIPPDANKNNEVEVEILPLRDAIKKYNTINVGFDFDKGMSLIIHGDMYIEGNINEEWFSKQRDKYDNKYIENILISGNLYVSGNILDSDSSNSIFLKVKGNVYADFILSEDGIIEVEGDTITKYGIYGEYNDGYIKTIGVLKTSYLIVNDHEMDIRSDREFVYIEGGYGIDKSDVQVGLSEDERTGWGWNYFDNSYRFFKQEVWNEDDEFNVDKFLDLIKIGINPFVELE